MNELILQCMRLFVFFFEYTSTRFKEENMLMIFNFKIFSDRKVNLVLTFRRAKLKVHSIFQNNWEKQKKVG